MKRTVALFSCLGVAWPIYSALHRVRQQASPSHCMDTTIQCCGSKYVSLCVPGSQILLGSPFHSFFLLILLLLFFNEKAFLVCTSSLSLPHIVIVKPGVRPGKYSYGSISLAVGSFSGCPHWEFPISHQFPVVSTTPVSFRFICPDCPTG